ncbi:MAG: VWA domain-containing protein [Pirellulaceae bacterium]
MEEHAARRGHRLDLARVRALVAHGTPNLLVHGRRQIAVSAYVGVLIDRSGSMEGEKMDRAKQFGVLVTESLKGLRGITGHVNAFDDDTFFWLGGFRCNAVSSLDAGGGNNDAAALQDAAALALASRQRNKLLIMISDGMPTQCTFESLKHLVEHLTRHHNITCAQVAVDRLEHIAFPHFIDLTAHPADHAIYEFGRLLIRLTQHWR